MGRSSVGRQPWDLDQTLFSGIVRHLSKSFEELRCTKTVETGRRHIDPFGSKVGVRDLVARGYSIPGRMRQRGGGRAPAFRVARCRTQSGVRLDGLGWVPSGPVGVRQGPVWSRIGPYISRTLIRDSRVIRQGSSGQIGPKRVPTGFHRNPVLARRDPTGLDRSLDCPISMND